MNYSQGKFDPKHPVITQSFLNMFADCAYAAIRRYVRGEILPPGIAALQGTATDAAVTLGCQSVIKDGRDAKLSDKKELASSVFDGKKDNHQIFPEDDLPALKDQTIQLVELHHKEIAPNLKPISVQESIVVQGKEYDLAGTIDIVEKGHLLADTKTSKSKYSEDAVQTNIQPALYSILYEDKYGVQSKGFRYDVLIKTKNPSSQQVFGKINNESKAILDYQIKSTIQEMNTGLATGVHRLAAPGHWRCMSSGKWCGYLYNGCPKGKRQ